MVRVVQRIKVVLKALEIEQSIPFICVEHGFGEITVDAGK
jgi:hypothetical protein